MIDVLAQGRSRARMPRSLIIAPTRELADQVAQNFEKYGKNHKLSMALLIGGVSFGDQDRALEKGVDVLIATPGRLLDQFERGKILLSGVDILVIDEADRMLDMGFIPDVERICSLLGQNRQTLLFSATMPPPIKKLADRFMSSPKQIEVERQSSTHKNIEQRLVEVSPRVKRRTLKTMLQDEAVTSAIIFCNRKRDVKSLTEILQKEGFAAGQIHGDMEQKDRMATMAAFKADELNVLIASDVAARGLDIKGVSHVFNYDVPFNAEDYVHRVGRTGRAGATGVAITLVTPSEAELVQAIEQLTGQTLGSGPPAAGEKKERAGAKHDRQGADEKPEEGGEDGAASSEGKQEAKKPSRGRRRGRKKAEKPELEAEQGAGARARAAEAEEPEGEGAMLGADDAADDWNGPVPSFLQR